MSTVAPKKPRTCKKCDYLVEEVFTAEDKEQEIRTVTATVFKDASEAEKYIREHFEALKDKTLRIVRVCKVVTVKPVEQPKFKLEDVR